MEITEEITARINKVKKELYRTKVMAKFSHYTFGNLYYTIDASGGIYQFPIPTVEVIKNPLEGKDEIMLSRDLGATTFSAEVKASELNRWIAKAIEQNEFVKIT